MTRLATYIKRHPLLFAWLGAVLVLAYPQLRNINTPAYWDALLYWNQAVAMAAHPWLPFVFEYDPGHPPLVSWMVALLWQLPIPRIPAFHLLSWSFTAVFLAAVFETARRAFGPVVAGAAALCTALAPVVVAQSLQLNLDMFLAAWLWLGIYAATAGRPVLLAVACTGFTMTKLNGMLLVAPFCVLAFYTILMEQRHRDVRAWVSGFWPMAAALAVFAVYHVVKVAVAGHLFDTGEFEDGEQLKMIRSPDQFIERLFVNSQRMMNSNGNWYVLALLMLVGFVFSCASCFPGFRKTLANWRNPVAARQGESFLFSRPLSPLSVMALIWLAFAVTWSSQAIRFTYTLERYFIPCYPVLYITLFALVRSLAGRWTVYAIPALTLPILFVFFVKIHPRHLDTLLPGVRPRIEYPPEYASTNFEVALDFTDMLDLLREPVRDLNALVPEGGNVFAVWPFDQLIHRPEHGIGTVPYRLNFIHDLRPDNRYDAVVLTRIGEYFHDDPEELADLYPGMVQYRVYRQDRHWFALYLPEEMAGTEGAP